MGLEAEFAFDSHWDNLGKTVIFRAGDKVITAALEGDTHIVPWEVVEKPDLWLIVGVYGANPEGTVVIPTLWTTVGPIQESADPTGDTSVDPTLPVWAQLAQRVDEVETLVSHAGLLSDGAKQSLVAILRAGLYLQDQSAGIQQLEAMLEEPV